MENVSNINIFIQSGDIVKGDKQDRIFQYDLVVRPKSGRVPIASFCVEQQRWSKRKEEDLYQFNSSNKRVSSKRLKMAAKHAESQAEVWQEVKVVQNRLSSVAGKSVNSPESASSLQLTLEDKEIEKLTKEYMDNIFQAYSDGIRKRFTIARSLLNNPHVIFMDEPDASLDANIKNKLCKFIKEEQIHKQKKTL